MLTAILSKRLLHPVRGLGLQPRQHMRVGIEGQRDLTVSESLHDDTRVNSLRKQERRCGVAEVMDANGRQLRRLEHGLEHPPDVSLVEGRADRGGENEALVDPPRTGEKPLSALIFSLALQRVECKLGSATTRRLRSLLGSTKRNFFPTRWSA